MDGWLKIGNVKKKENAKQEQLHGNKGTGGVASNFDINDKLERKHKMLTAISTWISLYWRVHRKW
jgi:hypothetical protein